MVSVHFQKPRVAHSTRRTTGGLCLPPPPTAPIIPAVAAVFETAELGKMIFKHSRLADRARARRVCRQFRDLVHLLGPKLGYENSSEYRNFDIVLENVGKRWNVKAAGGQKRVPILEPDTGDVDPLTDYIFMNPYLYKYFNGNTESGYTVKFDTKSFADDELPKHMEHQIVAYKALGMPNGYELRRLPGGGHKCLSPFDRNKVVHTELFLWSNPSHRDRAGDPRQGFIWTNNPDGVTLGQLKEMAIERQAEAEGYEDFDDPVLLYFGHISILYF